MTVHGVIWVVGGSVKIGGLGLGPWTWTNLWSLPWREPLNNSYNSVTLEPEEWL